MDGKGEPSTVALQQLQPFQQIFLNQALTQGIKRNEEQSKIWSEYKARHENVIKGLQTFPLELTTNCMVPISKRAMMKGRLIHTNEILVCLGDGYFGKYSAAQAIDLCNRRIKQADEMLLNLAKEKNLYEMRQTVPLDNDAFGNEQRQDIVEHWDEEKLENWRVQHRRREKEYRQKLAQLRNRKKTEIRTEEDLFQRLDELELEEELEDEIDRLQDSKEAEAYYESEEESSSYEDENMSDEATNEILEKELVKLKDIRAKQGLQKSGEGANLKTDVSSTQSDVLYEKKNISFKEDEKRSFENCLQSTEKKDCTPKKSSIHYECSNSTEKKVYFMEPNVLDERNVPPMEEETPVKKNAEEYCEDSDSEVIRVEFSHSKNEPVIQSEEGVLQSPRDVYKMFCKPKSILKRSPNDMIGNQGVVEPMIYSTDEEDENVPGDSTYTIVVKDIQERKIEPSMEGPSSKVMESIDAKRPISRFKISRTNKKN